MEQLSAIFDRSERDRENLTPMDSRSLRRIIRSVFEHLAGYPFRSVFEHQAGCPILAKLGWAYSVGPKGHPYQVISGESRVPPGPRVVPRVVESSAPYSGT
jgi:hypothetical protein